MKLKIELHFQQKPIKPKIKKKILPKKIQTATKKPSVEKSDIVKSSVKKSKPLASKLKKSIKKMVSSNESDSENDESATKSSTVSVVERKPAAKKFKKQMIEKIAKAKPTDVKDVVVRKRMASLNASAMMAATYEVERQLDKCEAKMYKYSPGFEEPTATLPKKAKDIKDEVLEPKDVSIRQTLSFKLVYIMFLIILYYLFQSGFLVETSFKERCYCARH